MSSKDVQKMSSTPSDGSDDEYEPPNSYNQKQNPYEGLEISSSESDAVESEEDSIIEEVKEVKKSQKKVRKTNTGQSNSGDEIDKSIREVNAMFGESSHQMIPPVEEKAIDRERLFAARKSFLDFSTELTKRFGPAEPETGTKRNKNRNRVKPVENNPLISHDYKFKRRGLSMSVDRIENGYTYFTFNHSQEYQQQHHLLLQLLSTRSNWMGLLDSDIIHVEALLEQFEVYCQVEEFSMGIETLEKIIAYMLFCGHHYFSLTNRKTRLEYKVAENRVFLIALLKYVHILSNKGCHRTALELAKILLNLDQSDPLAVVFIIDTLALRAREYTWLIDAVDCLDKDRKVKFLFNMQFSYALAHYHIALLTNDDLKPADDLLKSSIIRFPYVLKQIMTCRGNRPSEKIQSCHLFNEYAESTTDQSFKELIKIYVAFTASRWHEPLALPWLLRNVDELADMYNNEPSLKEEIAKAEQVRQSLFRGWPVEVYRHLRCIKSFSLFLVDGAVPDVPGFPYVHCFNPAPGEDSINRYKYGAIDAKTLNTRYGIFSDFLSSIYPAYGNQPEERVQQFTGPIEALRNFCNESEPGDDSEDPSPTKLILTTIFIVCGYTDKCNDETTQDSDDE